MVARATLSLPKRRWSRSDNFGIDPPTHVFLQAGVGGFASSIAGPSRRRGWATRTSGAIVVEPDRAACVFVSAQPGRLSSLTHTEPTVMAMLECYTPSLIAWRILNATASAFITVSEEEAKDAMRELAFRTSDPIVAGESGAAGLAGFLSRCA